MEAHEAEPDAIDELVLVVVVNNRRDWEIVRQERWYRVPLKRAPRQVGADYLAFYQTATFEEEKWSIRYYAPVRGVRLARRRELLPDEADHPRAEERYYRYDLGTPRTLDPPLPSQRLRRVTFIHTTLGRLLEAGDVADLWLEQPLRERLWLELNRQGIHAQRDTRLPVGVADRAFDFIIPCQHGAVAIDCLAPPGPDTPHGWRERPSSYPPDTGEQLLEGQGCSWLRFQDTGWTVPLDPYVAQVWDEIERRGGQL